MEKKVFCSVVVMMVLCSFMFVTNNDNRELKDGVTILKEDDVSRELVAQLMNLSSGPVGTVFVCSNLVEGSALYFRMGPCLIAVRELNKGNSSGGICSLFQNGIDLSLNDFSGDTPYSFTSMILNGNLIHSSLSGPVGNVASLLHGIASKSTASMHVDPLILALCFLLCFLVLKQQQQQQPQPPEQKLPADLDQDEQLSQHDLDQEDEHEDGQEVEEEHEHEDQDEPFYPNAEEQFFWKDDDRALWKRERGGRRHWKKRFNSHH